MNILNLLIFAFTIALVGKQVKTQIVLQNTEKKVNKEFVGFTLDHDVPVTYVIG